MEESCLEEDKPTKQGKSKINVDQHIGQVVKAWEDGSVKKAATERGEAGFLVGNFKRRGHFHVRGATCVI